MFDSIPAITDRRIRIALVGCGRISHNHIKAIHAHRQRAEIVALCDPQPERLHQASELLAELSREASDECPNPDLFSTKES